MKKFHCPECGHIVFQHKRRIYDKKLHGETIENDLEVFQPGKGVQMAFVMRYMYSKHHEPLGSETYPVYRCVCGEIYQKGTSGNAPLVSRADAQERAILGKLFDNKPN